MSAQIYNIRNYQSKKDLERIYAALREFIDAPRETIPGGGAGIDGLVYESSMGFVGDKDPA